MTRCARDLLNGNRLAGQHRLVDARSSLDHDAIDGHLFAGPHAQDVSDVDVGQRNVLLRSVRRDAASRSSAEDRAARDRGRCPRARRNSSIWPSSVSETMTEAASKYTATRPPSRNASGKSPERQSRAGCRHRRPRRRCRSASTCSGCDCGSSRRSGRRTATPPTARPASTSTSSIHDMARGASGMNRWPPIASTTPMTVSGNVHQKRRVKSSSSGFSSSRATASPARAPCRRSDSCPVPAGGSADASGTCRSSPPGVASRAHCPFRISGMSWP